MLLDEAMPNWHKREVHRIATDASPEALFRAFDELTWGEVAVFKALMTVRGLGRRQMSGDARVNTWFFSSGFVELARTDDEILVVSAEPATPRRGGIRTPTTIDEYTALAAPGCIKIAFNFTGGDGYLTTETRVMGTDLRAQRVFAAYWLLIRPFSGIIRRVWLRAIRKRAHRSPVRR